MLKSDGNIEVDVVVWWPSGCVVMVRDDDHSRRIPRLLKLTGSTALPTLHSVIVIRPTRLRLARL